MDRLDRSKSMARALRHALKQQGIVLSHSACLELVARQHGYPDWNVMSAALHREPTPAVTVFVSHGREDEAARFYETAFGAIAGDHHDFAGETMAIDLLFGSMTISVCGSNPRREAGPQRGGPFAPKANGAVSTIFRLAVDDIDAVFARAVAAGATIRDRIDRTATGQRAGSLFDPYGHIWGIEERRSAIRSQAA